MKSIIISLILVVLITLGLIFIWDKPVNNPSVLNHLGLVATTTMPNTSSTATHEYTSKIFSLSYADPLVVQKPDEEHVLLELDLPKSFDPGTNFSEAKLYIKQFTDSAHINNCAAATNGEQVVGQASIGGQLFTKLAMSDAGAGNRYDTTSYRSLYDGDCYVLEYVIHSTNIGNYPAESGIKEFDRARVEAILEEVIKSFHLSQGLD